MTPVPRLRRPGSRRQLGCPRKGFASGLALTPGVGNPQIGTSAYVYTLTYDHAGNIQTATDPYNGSWTYNYDTLNRLVSAADTSYQGSKIVASSAPVTLQCWLYDNFGNRTYELANPASCPTTGSAPTGWTHRLQYAAGPNQVTAIDGNALQYDLAGNVTYDGTNHYVYDREGRICAVWSPGPVYTQYVYDAEGNRVARGAIPASDWPATGATCNAPTAAKGFTPTSIWLKSANGGQDTQIYYPGQGLYSGVGAITNTNVYADGSLLATYSFSIQQTVNGNVQTLTPTLNLSFAFSDWLGSKRLQINSAGQAINTWASDPFGNYLTPGAGGNTDATDRHFTGQERDTESGTGIAGTGNDYFGARYYGSSMGRFMSPDPSQLYYADPTNPQSFNLYSYVLNNPLIAIDPDGLDCIYTSNLTWMSVSVETVRGDCLSDTDNGVFVDGTVNTDSYKAQVGSDGDVHLGYGYTSDDDSSGTDSDGSYTLTANSGSTDIGAAVHDSGGIYSMSQDDRIQQLAQGVTADSQHSFGCIAQAYKTEAEGLIPSVGVGVPLPGSKRFQGWRASDGTSFASRTLASAADSTGFPRGRYPSPTGGLFAGGKPFEMKTTPNAGRAAGRYAPYIGTAITTGIASWNLWKCL